MKTKRVTLFLPSLSGGGAERVMVSLANGLAARSLDVELVLAQATGPYVKEVARNVKLVDLKACRLITALPKFVFYLLHRKPDVVMSTLTDANLVVLWAKLFSGSRAKFIVREASNLIVNSYSSEKVRARLLPFLVGFFYRYADRVVLPSHGAKKDFDKALPQYKEKSCVVYNPVSSELLFHRGDALSPGVEEYISAPFVLAVGRLTEAKGYETLFKAFRLLLKKKSIRLLVLGEGELRPQLEKLAVGLQIDDYISMPGFVENPFVFMKHASLYVLSSRWEGLPNTLIQATVFETPVVATNCPHGPADILEEGRWGTLVPVDKPLALAKAMMNMLENPRPSSDRKSRERFCPDRIVGQYLKILGLE